MSCLSVGAWLLLLVAVPQLIMLDFSFRPLLSLKDMRRAKGRVHVSKLHGPVQQSAPPAGFFENHLVQPGRHLFRPGHLLSHLFLYCQSGPWRFDRVADDRPDHSVLDQRTPAAFRLAAHIGRFGYSEPGASIYRHHFRTVQFQGRKRRGDRGYGICVCVVHGISLV